MNFSKEPSQSYICSFSLDSMPEWRPNYLTGGMSASLISISVINLLVSPSTVLLNILVMIAVKTTPRLRNNCNILLASLAGTDLIVGALSQPLFVADQIYRLTGNFESHSVCALNFVGGSSAVFCVTASTQHLAILSIERYIAICYPYKYPKMVTKRSLGATVVFAWSAAVFLTGLMVIYTINNTLALVLHRFVVIASISILIFCQTAVYREACIQMRKIKAQQISMEAKQTFLKEKKALGTTTIVIGVLLFSYVPLIVFRLVLNPLLSSPVVEFALEAAFRSLVFCNSVCNPLIYCVRNSEFRRAFKRQLSKQNQIQPD